MLVIKKRPVLVLFLAIILTSVLLRSTIVAIGPISEIVISDLRISSASFGLITTIPLIVFAFTSALIPFIASKNGLINTLMGGVVLILIGSGLRALGNYNILLFGTILVGFGISIGNVLIPAIIKDYAGKHRAVFTSTYLCGQNIFAALASGVAFFVAIHFSWPFLMGVWIIPAIIALIFWLYYKSHGEYKTITKEASINKFALPIVKELLKSRYAWCITAIMALQSIIYFAQAAWLPTILDKFNLSPETISFVVIFYQVIAVPGMFLIPIIIKRMKHNSFLLLINSVFIVSGSIMLFFANSFVLIFISTMLISIGVGVCFAWVVTVITFVTKNSQQASSLSAMSQTIGYLLAATGPWFGGVLVDITHTSHSIIVFMFVVCVLIAVISIYVYVERAVLSLV